MRVSQWAVQGWAVGVKQQQPRSSGVCQHKRGRFWALSFGAGTCHTVLQVIALGCPGLVLLYSTGSPGLVTMP